MLPVPASARIFSSSISSCAEEQKPKKLVGNSREILLHSCVYYTHTRTHPHTHPQIWSTGESAASSSKSRESGLMSREEA